MKKTPVSQNAGGPGKNADASALLNRRRRFLLTCLLLTTAAVGYRAFRVQVVERETWRSQAEEQQARQTWLPAPRGTIYDRDGVPLAASDEAFRINLAPREIVDRGEIAALLQKHVGLTRAAAQRATDPDRQWVVLPGRFGEATRQSLHGKRGVYFDRVLRRFYPRGNIASELVGSVAADGQALGGLELEFNGVLVGKPGRAVQRLDAFARPVPGALQEVMAPMAGQDVYLTIDADLQEIAREALADAIAQTNAVSGEIVMADPRTGEILAAVTSKPGMQSWRAATEPYEPGSTIKPFAIATLLAEKKARLDDSVFAENGEYEREGRTIKDVHPYGWLTVAGALQHSSNIALAKLSERLDPMQQYAYLRAFGFGSPTAVTYPSESGGLLRRPAGWSKYSSASLAIGYEISVTPLQMLMAYGALANGGVLMEPRLVREVRARDGLNTQRYEPRAVRRVIPTGIADELRGVLTDVVEQGTGQSASVGEFAVAGKTGTARSFAGGRYTNGAYTSSFAGFFPAVEPQLVFLVKLDSPRGAYYGGLTAAPVTRATLEAALAALSTPLDKRAVAAAAPPPLMLAPAMSLGAHDPVVSGPFIFALDAAPVTRHNQQGEPEVAAVPDVSGLPIRDAVRRLHASGFRVRVSGTGTVGAVEPAIGATVPRGALVRLAATEVDS